MAVAFDAFTQGPNSSITSTPSTSTWTHTVGSGSSRAVLVAIHSYNSNYSVTSATYGGTAMTLLGTIPYYAGAWAETRIYGMLNPPTGASTVSLTVSTIDRSTDFQMSSTSYSGVSGGFGTVTTATVTGSINGFTLAGGDGVSFVALTGVANAYPYGAALKGTWRSENPTGTPRTGIIESTARNGVGWNSYNQASDVFNTVKVQLLDASDPFASGTPQQLTNTVYTQNAKYGSGNVFATYSTMNDGTASGASGATATSTGGDWIKADCGAARNISHIIIGYDYLNNLSGGWGVSYTKDVKVQGSLDNSTWTDITLTPNYTTTGSSNGLVTVPLYANYRYIRLTKTDHYFALTEFQVWAMPTPTSGFFAMF